MRRARCGLGKIRVKIISANPLGVVEQIVRMGCSLLQVESKDFLTVEIVCAAKEYRKIYDFLTKRGYQFEVLKGQTYFLNHGAALRRWALVCPVMLILLATIFLPTRILFVQVTGNQTISVTQILESARECGIGFFCPRKQVRSEKMKNALLEAIPQLQWAGINTNGCVATIQVKERKPSEQQARKIWAGNIIAERDAVIYSCTVEEGSALCKVGQAVQKGQTLVSGYRDNGLFVSNCGVIAEIQGLTNRDVTLVTPCSYDKRVALEREDCRYSLRIGKKIINLQKGSGISTGTCVKIYTEEYMTLPGGFQLPVSIIRERTIYTRAMEEKDSITDHYDWLNDHSRQYVLGQMVAGQILHQLDSMQLSSDACVYKVRFACLEMIGKDKFEEIIKHYGENE